MESIHQLLKAFRTQYPEFKRLRASVSSQLKLGTGPAAIYLRIQDDRYVVETDEAHGHLDEPDSAFDLIANLLRGAYRTVEEYRGEKLASTWIEIPDRDAHEVRHLAIFTSPYDADEWQLWPGEEWIHRKTRRTYSTDDGKVLISQEEKRARCLGGQIEQLQWLEEALGPPVEGMRWTTGVGLRCVFQAPSGWRRSRIESSEEGPNFVDFAPQAEGLAFRERHFFRKAAQPAKEPKEHAVEPLWTKFETVEEAAGWVRDTWTLMFSDGQLEMMAVLDLFHHQDKAAEEAKIRPRIHASAPHTVLVPHTWHMGPPDPSADQE